MGKKRAILCVDDEALMLLALTHELRRRFKDRFLYEQALSAEEGLKAIDELIREDIEVIIIISDWLMPGMKGDEFLERVNSSHPGIKEIMITGQADEEALERLRKNPALIAIFPSPGPRRTYSRSSRRARSWNDAEGAYSRYLRRSPSKTPSLRPWAFAISYSLASLSPSAVLRKML